jgi:hypothetical protein
VILEVSPAVYEEIRLKLIAADYRHCFNEQSGKEVIDMTGIALQAENEETLRTSQCPLCLHTAELPGFIGICPACGKETREAIRKIRSTAA